jgi:predicted transcriptional regulator
MNNGLEGEIRKKLYETIEKNPGLHLSKIADMLCIRTSLAEYHLKYLEKNEVIISIKKTGDYYRRYYTKDSPLGTDDKKILGLLREEMLLNIILLLLRKERLRHKDILASFTMTPPTLSYYLEKLVTNGVVEVTTFGEDRGYTLCDRKRIIRLLLSHEFHIVAEEFKSIWDDLHYW